MGAVALARAVKGSKGLQRLELDDNQISEDGVAHVQARCSKLRFSHLCSWVFVHARRQQCEAEKAILLRMLKPGKLWQLLACKSAWHNRG
jgi:hypothetical protein